jgi:hypothetical protein
MLTRLLVLCAVLVYVSTASGHNQQLAKNPFATLHELGDDAHPLESLGHESLQQHVVHLVSGIMDVKARVLLKNGNTEDGKPQG